MMRISGVYRILNCNNQKVYIGSSRDVHKRWTGHQKELRRGKHHSRHLQAAWSKHGEEAFVFETVLVCAEDALLMYEQLLIDHFGPEYNICPTAGSARGVRRSAEYCAAMAKRNTGKKLSAESIKKRTEKLRGRKQSLEERKARSVAQLGRKFSDEHRKKLSVAKIGKPQSATLITKRVAKNTGQKRTPEQCARISQGIRDAYAKKLIVMRAGK